jgi:hypothetical protein
MYGIINKRTLCAHNMIHEVKKGAELTGWRFSMSGYRNQDWLINIPLPLIQEWIKAAK